MLSGIQAAFLAEGGVQCGFCTPGFVVSVHDLLEHNPDPTELEVREAVSGNLCRCTGYGRILAAVQAVKRRGRHEHRTRYAAWPARRERAPGPTGFRRSEASSPSPRTCSPRACSGGTCVRSPHPSAAIRGIDMSEALRIPGVRAVLTSDDVPGRKTYGLDYPDQPVFAWDVVRFMGEPVAAVAADHPETARRAAAAISRRLRADRADDRSGGRGRRRADPSSRQRAPPPKGPLR